jgi:hypothetical protein
LRSIISLKGMAANSELILAGRLNRPASASRHLRHHRRTRGGENARRRTDVQSANPNCQRPTN